jgi:hypothetical protein
MSTLKIINLFQEPEPLFFKKTKKRPNLFTDHEAFAEKFVPKKTTDDCYTPPAVYDIVLDYVRQHCDIEGRTIVRPFYPGGDFEALEYPDGCVVIDNPPFSIITKIVKFYLQHGIGFFLFAPHLTLFSSDMDCTHIVVGGDITYENGAQVKTSFLSNLFGEAKVIGDPALLQKFRQLADAQRVNLPKYVYPPNVLTVSHVAWVVEKGIPIRIDKGHTRHCRGLEAQKKHRKSIFGSGFLISDKAAADKAAADKAAADKAAADKAAADKAAADKAAADKAAADKVNVITWALSEKERNIIKKLSTDCPL